MNHSVCADNYKYGNGAELEVVREKYNVARICTNGNCQQKWIIKLYNY